MGPPGAGKGTQAELVAHKFDLIHFDVGRYLESLFMEGQMPSKIREEFKRGSLVSPAWMLKKFRDRVKRIADAGFGIALSGSPRSVLEAFGSSKNKGVMNTLVSAYGKNNVFIFELDIPPRTTMLRNSKRRVCSVCWKPCLPGTSSRSCPFCGGKLKRRVQDKPSIIKNRLKEYEERTKPVIGRLKDTGFKVVKIDGRPRPAVVFGKISRRLK